MTIPAPPNSIVTGTEQHPASSPVSEYKSHISTLTSGTILHIWNTTSTSSRSESKAIIILQHGFSEYSERYVNAYNRLIPHLVDAGYDVWGMDMWGHGRSPGTRGSLDISRAVDDHVEVRRKVAESWTEHGGVVRRKPVFLLGHSLGGLVTAGSVVRAAQEEQKGHGDVILDPLCGVVLTGSALVSPSVIASSRFLARSIAAVVPNLRLNYSRVEIEKACRGNPEEVARMSEDPMMFHGHISFRIAATSLQVSNEVWAGLADRWTAPTLVIHGISDTYTDHRQSVRFVEMIASQDKTLQLVEGGYHESLNDIPGRDATLRQILEWLETRTHRWEA